MKKLRKITALITICLITGFGTTTCNEKQNKNISDSTKTDMGGFFKAGSKPGLYEIGLADHMYNDMPVYYIKSTENVDNGFGTIMTGMKPDEYLNKRIRMSGYIKCEKVDQSAGMWFRIDGYSTGVMLGFDNMFNRPIEGTKDWQRYEIVLDVPDTSAGIAYGVLLSGNGTVWLSGISFEAVGKDIPVTNILTDAMQEQPVEVSKELPVELRNIPDGIEVMHSPVNVQASVNKNDTTMLYWFHQTSVKALKEDIEITEFGTYTWAINKWEFGNIGAVPFSPKEFAEWYECKNWKLKKGKLYTDKNNWSRWTTLQKSTSLWYYIGKNKKGELFKGTAIVNYLPTMKK